MLPLEIKLNNITLMHSYNSGHINYTLNRFSQLTSRVDIKPGMNLLAYNPSQTVYLAASMHRLAGSATGSSLRYSAIFSCSQSYVGYFSVWHISWVTIIALLGYNNARLSGGRGQYTMVRGARIAQPLNTWRQYRIIIVGVYLSTEKKMLIPTINQIKTISTPTGLDPCWDQ